MAESDSRPIDHSSLYRAAFEQSLVGIAISDAGDDAVLEVNDAMCAMLGYERGELIAKGFAALTHPGDLKQSTEAIRQVVAGELEHIQFEKRYIRQNGQAMWAMVHARFVTDKDGGPGKVLRQSWDITDRHESERRLRESEARYRGASEGSLDCFCLLQAVRNEAGAIVDFRVIDANERCWRLLQIPRDRLIGMQMSGLPHSKPDGFIREFAVVAETGQAYEEEFQIEWPGLAAKWMHHQVVKAGEGVAVSSRDITARKESERTLRESEGHYRKLAESNRRLLSEVNHRVRNNLATLLAIVALLRRRHLSTHDFAADLESKLRAMGTIHNTMADADWQPVNLDVLASRVLALLHHTASQPIEVKVSGPPVEVTGRQCLPLTMTLHELFTNSCKYGAYRSAEGHIDVTWSVEASSVPCKQTVTLRWVERGGPPITGPITPALGHDLIVGFIEHDLAGKAALAYPPEGAAHTLAFDITTKASETNPHAE